MTESQRESVPRVDGSEKEIALSFLRFARHCLVKKTEGLDEEQLRRVHVPSGTSLLGLVQHVTAGERWSDVDFTMAVPEDDSPTDVLDRFRVAVDDSERILAAVDLDAPLHAGHADILRELTDGVTGR